MTVSLRGDGSSTYTTTPSGRLAGLAASPTAAARMAAIAGLIASAPAGASEAGGAEAAGAGAGLGASSLILSCGYARGEGEGRLIRTIQ